jgi:PleD family two-component response regulator
MHENFKELAIFLDEVAVDIVDELLPRIQGWDANFRPVDMRKLASEFLTNSNDDNVPVLEDSSKEEVISAIVALARDRGANKIRSLGDEDLLELARQLIRQG